MTMKGHAGAVRSVDFSSDSRHLITASDDKTAKVHTTHEHFLDTLLTRIKYCTRQYTVRQHFYLVNFLKDRGRIKETSSRCFKLL